MYVNVFFDEEDIADVILLPDGLSNITSLQIEFLQWLFNEENDHEYWELIDGKKMFCKYGIDAFIKWINDYILSDSTCKAIVFKRNCRDFCSNDFNLFF